MSPCHLLSLRSCRCCQKNCINKRLTPGGAAGARRPVGLVLPRPPTRSRNPFQTSKNYFTLSDPYPGSISDTYILTFYLTFFPASILASFRAFILAFYLASILTFYLAFYLVFCLTYVLKFCTPQHLELAEARSGGGRGRRRLRRRRRSCTFL